MEVSFQKIFFRKKLNPLTFIKSIKLNTNLNKPGVIYSEKEIFRVKFNPDSDLYHWACINCNGMQYDY